MEMMLNKKVTKYLSHFETKHFLVWTDYSPVACETS
jgi:hypothetical protein